MLSEQVQKILQLPKQYVDEYNSTATQNYWALIDRLITIIKPKHLCEIGVERGFSSEFFHEKISKLNMKHSLVDPSFALSKERNLSGAIFNEETSALYFSKNHNDFPDFFILDGDHNYSTVTMELSSIDSKRDPKSPTCILLHDVAWPWGRRDMYYNPEDFESETGTITSDTSLCLENESFSTRGFPSGSVYFMNGTYGGRKNGVLTAIEDFLVTTNGAWSYTSNPMFFGLGILWTKAHLSQNQIEQLSQFRKSLEELNSIFACAEANRLRLLQGLDEHKDDLVKLKNELSKITNELNLLKHKPVFQKFKDLIKALL